MAHVLIVDDSTTALRALESLLKSDGHEVTCAENGMQGLLKAVGRQYDLVISDLNMPKMGGMKMIEKLRKENATLPIFVLTTEGRPEIAAEAKAVGATGWITKPFQIDQLRAAVAHATS